MKKEDVVSTIVSIAKDLVSEEEQKEAKMVFNKKSALRDIREAQVIVASAFKQTNIVAAGEVVIDRLPGLSPMQLRKQIDIIVGARQEATMLRQQYEKVLNDIARLDGVASDGVKKLTEAAKQLKEKEKYLVESEKGLLTFTAYVTSKVPGVEQMLKNPEDAKAGEKAGDFFGRVGRTLGDAIKKEVEIIYQQTKEDLTHMTDAVRTLTVVGKTASVSSATVYKAGLSDVLISIKDWIAGKSPDSLASRLLNFSEGVARWVRGFAERTGLVNGATKRLTDSLSSAQKEINSYLA